MYISSPEEVAADTISQLDNYVATVATANDIDEDELIALSVEILAGYLDSFGRSWIEDDRLKSEGKRSIEQAGLQLKSSDLEIEDEEVKDVVEYLAKGVKQAAQLTYMGIKHHLSDAFSIGKAAAGFAVDQASNIFGGESDRSLTAPEDDSSLFGGDKGGLI